MISLAYTWELLVDVHNVSMEKMDLTEELFTTWLDETSFAVLNMQINGAVQLKHPLKYIHENSTMYWTRPHLILLGIVYVTEIVN